MGAKAKIAAMGLALASVGSAVGAYTYVHQSAEALPVETPEGEPYTESYICFAEHPDCSRDVGALAVLATGNQIKIPYESISPNIINAIVATEDRRFWQHDGIDDKGIARAVANGLVDSISNQEITLKEGASTIEMQLARNLYVADKPADDIERKKWEWGIALELDKTYSKEKIITMYANTVYFGRGAYGIQTAALAYLNKSADALDLLDAATLAAVLKSPDDYDGSDDPQKDAVQRQNLFERRNKVLGDMLETGAITNDQYNTYVAVQLDSYVLPFRTISAHDNYSVADFVGARHAVQMIIDDVKSQTGYTDNQLRNGLRINSTISQEMQASVVVAATTAGDYPRDGRQIAVVAMGKQGDILGLYGGDYGTSQVNLATTPGPTGSGDKAYFYTDWLTTGVITADQIFTEPSSFTWEGGGANGTDYVVEVGDHCSNRQACPIPEAIAVSSNMIPLQLAEDHQDSLQQTYDLMSAFGIKSTTPVVPAAVLGAREATLLDRTNGMAGLVANHGAAVQHFIVRSISKVDTSGSTTRLFDTTLSDPVQVVPVETANTMIQLLRGVPRAGGTAGKQLKDTPTDIAGKTGTHDDNIVAGFYATSCITNPTTGQTEDITLGVLERFVDTLSPLGKGQTGGNVPAAVYKQAIQQFLPPQPCDL